MYHPTNKNGLKRKIKKFFYRCKNCNEKHLTKFQIVISLCIINNENNTYYEKQQTDNQRLSKRCGIPHRNLRNN